MDISGIWYEEVLTAVKLFYPGAKFHNDSKFLLISTDETFFINIVSLNSTSTSRELIFLQKSYKLKNQFVIHLWEDIWRYKKAQVLSRLNSFLGLNQIIYARKTKVEKLQLATTKVFLNSYHLQGYAKSKHNFGLTYNDELIGIATFSELRPMKSKGENYQSAELIRFASKKGFTIVGGFSKLVKQFMKNFKVDDIMTYADRDWSLGDGYIKTGFEFSNETLPLDFYVDNNTFERFSLQNLPKLIIEKYNNQYEISLDHFLEANYFTKIFNTGNLKFYAYR